MSEKDEIIFAAAAILRAERERLGLSQAHLASLAGVTLRTQQNYESGRRAPDANYLAAIAAAGADVLYILTGQRCDASQELKPDEAALLDNYRHSPPEGQAAIQATSAALAKSKVARKKPA